MKVFLPRPGLREELVSVLSQSMSEFIQELNDTTSLIRTGLLDSLGLVEIALFIEREIGHPLDFSRVNPEQEWDTLGGIIQFIEKYY